MGANRFEPKVTGRTTAYLRLPTFQDTSEELRTVTLVDLLGAYKGPYVVFDFDGSNTLVGIEIVGDDDEDESLHDTGENAGVEGAR